MEQAERDGSLDEAKKTRQISLTTMNWGPLLEVRAWRYQHVLTCLLVGVVESDPASSPVFFRKQPTPSIAVTWR